MSYVDFFTNGLTDLIPIRKGDKRPTGKWTEVTATPELVASWEGGNLGLRTTNFPVIDIDVQDGPLAEALHDLAVDMLGTVPCRTGLAPKRALLYRLRGDVFPKRWLQFERDGVSYRVEILAGGQYLVIGGTHPSGTEYTWDEMPKESWLPMMSASDADQYLRAAAKLVEQMGWTVVTQKTQSTVEQAPDQATLAGDLAEVAQLMAAIPNTTLSREEYLRMGFALKASLPDHPDYAQALWHEWCTKWTGGTNDPAVNQRDWDGLQGPYRVGIDFLRLQAQAAGVDRAGDVFEPLEEAPAAGLPLEPWTDAWLARAFVERHGEEFRFCEETDKWLRWDGARWTPGSLAEAKHAVSVIAQAASHHAVKAEHTKWSLALKTVTSAVSYAAFNPALQVRLEQLDADPMTLNTPKGVVNLVTGQIASHHPALLCTRMTSVTPSPMATPKWDAFLLETTGGDTALIGYLQRLAGYCLTGVTTEQMFAFLWGPGGNGKGVFLNTLGRAIGDYAQVAPMNAFVASFGDRHPTDLASLAGARMVTAQETEEGRSWDEAKVKSITGGDPISARFMRGDFFTYVPRFKLVFAGNHRPHTKNLDDAMRRRLHLIPFTLKPVVVNTRLQEELTAELPGILAWAVAGCLAWQRDGLAAPTAVIEETQGYFYDEDLPGRWMEDRTVPSREMTSVTDLYNDWCRWCLAAGEQHGTMKAFAMILKNRGLGQARTSKGRGFLLGLASNRPPSVTPGGPVMLEDLSDPLPMVH